MCKTSLVCLFFIPDVEGQDIEEICREFVNRSVYCTRESNPHCGTDGITYGNKCAFCKAVLRSGGKIRLKHLGKC
ncbi:PREDICTED: serine protease inhibitor Kazal-type 6-like [Mesitornis unicolor]|uniref:serine protease inhibitor Kazal-type 6-like n=1 Tax=Mesitornis unicolor TaxID=54374 RepID=UPI000528DDA7|nr:PREDICTED: serine protease inhibitor Kazal-type 6-like [Mesitornis unicolor]